MRTSRWFLIAGALVVVASLSGSAVFAQSAKKQQAKPAETSGARSADVEKPKRTSSRTSFKTDAEGKLISPYSLAQRTALNRQDCAPNKLQKNGLGIHGHYRTYKDWDPELKSIEGRRQFEACVKRGLEPTPWFAIGQRATIAMGGKFFGKGKEDCLKCHSKY
jgi:hypothetical protein